jgi:hypothetical protein
MDLNFYALIQKPFYQTLIFLLLTPIVIFLMQPKTADKAWAIAAFVFAVYLLFNAVMLWFDDRSWRYFFISIGFAVGYLGIVALIMSGLVKVLQLKGSGESAMAFLVMMYQPVALLLVMFAKWIVTKWF